MAPMSRLERIVQACGGDLFDGGRRALIPGPRHSAADRSVSLLEAEDGRILIHCFSPKDDWRVVRRMLKIRGLIGAAESKTVRSATLVRAQPSRGDERLARAHRIWREGSAIESTIAQRYLAKRAVADRTAHCAALRFHASMTSLEDRLRRPALLSAITDVEGALQGVEITLLSSHGAAKAALAIPRRVVGRMMGGAIRLAEPQASLLIGEGMESTASASAALNMPAWALLGAHNLANFTLPTHVRRLVVAFDDDAAGRAAAERLRRRLRSTLAVEWAPPPAGFNDWNDWAIARAMPK